MALILMAAGVRGWLWVAAGVIASFTRPGWAGAPHAEAQTLGPAARPGWAPLWVRPAAAASSHSPSLAVVVAAGPQGSLWWGM